jgi:hypothetical protein
MVAVERLLQSWSLTPKMQSYYEML